MAITKKRNGLIFAVLIMGTFIASMTVTVTANMLPVIMGYFQIPTSTAQWLTSGATLVSGITIPVASYLIKRFQSKTYFLMAIGIFTAGALLGSVAFSFAVLLVGRLIQAVGCGMLLPFTQVVLMAIYPKEKHGTVMGAYSMAATFAPVVAPTIAGLIMDALGWQAMFWILFIAGGTVFLMGIFFMKNVTETYLEKFPLLPVILSSVGFAGILIGLGSLSGGSFWSLRGGGALLLGLVSLVLFVVMQLRAAKPFLDLRVFKHVKFRVSVIASMLVYLIVMGSASLLPIFTQTLQGHSATTFALITLPGAICMAILTFGSGTLYDKVGAKPLFLCGALLFPIGAILGISLGMGSSLLHIGAISFLFAVASSLINTPATAMGLSDLDARTRVDGSSILNTLRQISSSLATTMALMIYSVVSANGADITGVKTVYVYFLVVAAAILAVVLSFLFCKQPAD